jgi:hypothetical protein
MPCKKRHRLPVPNESYQCREDHPPITAITIGLQISDPDLNHGRGSIQGWLLADVMKTGLSLDLPEIDIAPYKFIALSLKLINRQHNCILDNDPISITAPIAEITLSVVLVRKSAIATPGECQGDGEHDNEWHFSDSNCEAIQDRQNKAYYYQKAISMNDSFCPQLL